MSQASRHSIDIKSLPIYFYVQRSSDFNGTGTPIPFELERLNVGGAMNLTSGKFTAPRDGIYFFEFTGRSYFPASSSRLYLDVAAYLNGNEIGRGVSDEVGTDVQYESFSFQWTLNLQSGDQIWLQISNISPGTYLDDNQYHTTHFNGMLLEENISQSSLNAL